MAYVDTSQNQQQPGQIAPNPAAQPVTTSTGGTAISKTPTSNVSNQIAGTNAPAQPFQNISTYLSANAPQVGQEANTIAGGLNQQAIDLGTATTNATGQFENQVNAATKNFTPEQAASFTANPAKFAQNPSDVATFEALYNNVTPYKGPTDFTSSQPYADLSTKAAGAANLGTSLKDFGGVQSYLQTLHPQSTAGTSALDTALLQGTPEAMAPINTAATTLAGTPANLASTAAREDALAKAALATTQGAAAAANTAGTNAITNFENQLKGEVTSAQKTAADTVAKYQSDLSKGDVNAVAADLKASGATPDQIAAITNAMTALGKDYTGVPTNLSQYVANPNVDINAANVATPGEYATEAALNKLTGANLADLNPANVAQAGTGTGPISIKAGDLGTALQTQLTQQDQTLLANPPQLAKLLPDMSDVKQGQRVATQYVDAFKRAGSPGYGSKNIQALPPQLQDLFNQAFTSYWGKPGAIITNPDGSYSIGKQYQGAATIVSQIMGYAFGTV